MLHAHDGRRDVVTAADRLARQAGIKPGLTLAHARSLAPAVQVAPANSAGDQAALQAIAHWLLWLSPIVAVDAPDGILVDTTGCAYLHGGETLMLQTIRRRLLERGITCRLALADTPGAAHALARYGQQTERMLDQKALPSALASLPVAALRLDRETAQGLDRMGLHRIGTLETTPRAPLRRRFGDQVLTRLDQAMGRVAEPLRPLQPRDAITVRETFVEPIGTADSIATVIRILVASACTMLARRGLGARQIDLLCERVDGTVQAVRVGLATPMHEPAHTTRLLTERIEAIEPGFGIEAMQLVVSRDEPMETPQAVGSLDPATRHIGSRGDIRCLIDRLRNRVGPDRVYRLIQKASHLPEQTQEWRPVAPDSAANEDRSAGFAQAVALPSSPTRPLRLLPEPEAVQVTSLLPDGPPRQLVWRGQRHRLRAADGPERLHDEWWRSAAAYGAIRDYWLAENEDGERFWLFRRGDGQHAWSGNGNWFVHGLV